MKRVGNLYDDICNLDNIIRMTDKVCSKVKNKEKVSKFELYKAEHIVNIKKRLEGNLNIGKYSIFLITDPKVRIVMSQDIEDKIINHLVAEYALVKVFDSKFTNSMIATRKGKGTLYGIKLLKKYLNEMKNKYDNFYVLKLDISKYFYSMNHDVLKSIIFRKIKDKKVLDILFKMIDSTNEDYINEKINELKEDRINYLKNSKLKNKENLIEEVKEVPLYEYGCGCSIGNQTSQAFGLIYLYELVHFIKEKLHIKYLCVYMDDFVIIHEDKDYLKYSLEMIRCKLDKYKLKLNLKKTKIDCIKNGIDFLGYNFTINNNKVVLKLRNRTKKNFKKKVKYLKILEKYGYIDDFIFKRGIASYKGILKWGSCNSLYRSVMYDMLEKYYKYKMDYKEYIIFIKCGGFYECLGRDALIINKLFNYKLKKFSNTFKVGFPTKCLDNVLNKISVNYIVIDKDVVKEKKFDVNNYCNYIFDEETIFYNSIRIEKIINLLNNNLTNNDLKSKLNEIENVLSM